MLAARAPSSVFASSATDSDTLPDRPAATRDSTLQATLSGTESQLCI